MGSTASLLLLGAAIVAAIGTVGFWLALRRPAQNLERRQRDEALAAAAHYTPAQRVSPYGPPPDPCAPGLSDAERVEAMRALLLRGDNRLAEATAQAEVDEGHAPTQPMLLRDAELTTSPMAWQPTLPPDEADDFERLHDARRARTQGRDHEHITV
mgnify:CR=1 FL=1|jgi:hypothetical protein